MLDLTLISVHVVGTVENWILESSFFVLQTLTMAYPVNQWRILVLLDSIALLLFLGLYKEYHREVVHCSGCSGTSDDQLAIYLETTVRESPSEDLGKNKTTHKKLSIDLVIVPFLKYSKASGVNRGKLTEREQEYRTVMQRNLNHPLVNSVHVLTTDPQETLRHFNNFTNQEKMIVSKVKSIAWMRDPFEYISLHLVGKDAMYANADIYLGDGFDLVDPEVMSHQNIMYSLSRQVSDKDKCRQKNLYNKDRCRELKYKGSHDAFLFRLKKPLTEVFLQSLKFSLPSLGMERVIMWAFQTKLKYCILNPCHILETFHLHCSGLRSHRKRPVNNATNSVQSPFTKKLVCK